MKNKKFCSQWSTYFKISGIWRQEGFQTVLMAAGDMETTHKNIQDWLELEGDPGYQHRVLL